MPSCQLLPQSGGIALVSGNMMSGFGVLSPGVGGISLKLSTFAPSGAAVYIGLNTFSGQLPTFLALGIPCISGGVLSSGGMGDGFEMLPGDKIFIPKSKLNSGLQSILLMPLATASGGRMFWDTDIRLP